MDLLDTIGISVIADVISAVVLGAGLFFVSTMLKRSSRKRIFEFLGLERSDPVLRVYLSRLDVVHGGSRGTDGILAHGFVGPALMQLEYLGAQSIESVVNDAFLDLLPDPIRHLMEAQSAYLRDVETIIDVSPDNDSGRAILHSSQDTVVLLGSDVYSRPVRRIYHSKKSFIRFVSEVTGDPFDASDPSHSHPTFAVQTDGRWMRIQGRETHREIGTIQRVTPAKGKSVLMCAGISASSTRGSAQYLAKHWRRFHERFGNDDFLVVLAFPEQKADSHAIVTPIEIRDYERQRRNH